MFVHRPLQKYFNINNETGDHFDLVFFKKVNNNS